MVDKKFVPSRASRLVPGTRILGLRLKDEFQVAGYIEDGFSTTAVSRLARELELPDKQVLLVAQIPQSTFRKRKRERKPLSAAASSRVYRIAKAAEAAVAYFEGDKIAARRWLTHPKVALGGATPLEFARTPEGSDYVIKLLERTEHGVVS